MRKKHALEILRGEKVREFRWYCDHWAKILCEFNDPNDKGAISGLKCFDRVHFYPYNNKWFLDVEFKDMGLYEVNGEFVAQYGNEVAASYGYWCFVIGLGKVIGTNLTLDEG